MIYLQLFWAFIQIGALSFGGGYAAMPLIQEQVIVKYGWMTQEDFTNLVAIAEMTPGPIAVNAATFVGNQMAGIPGTLVATLGVILPSLIFVTVLAWAYTKYRSLTFMQGILKSLRPAVISMILSAGITILLSVIIGSGALVIWGQNINIRMIVYFVAALFLIRKVKLNPILTMTGCGVAELLVTLIL